MISKYSPALACLVKISCQFWLEVFDRESALSEETAQPTVYHHLIQVSVDMQLSGLIKSREDTGVLMQVNQLIFRQLSWVLPESATYYKDSGLR